VEDGEPKVAGSEGKKNKAVECEEPDCHYFDHQIISSTSLLRKKQTHEK
jgi:hypothetical protein